MKDVGNVLFGKNSIKLTRVAKKLKRHGPTLKKMEWDLPYLFLHHDFSIVASLAHPEEKTCLKLFELYLSILHRKCYHTL